MEKNMLKAFVSLVALLTLVGCGDEEKVQEPVKTETKSETTSAPKAKLDPPKPAQEPLIGEASPSLLVTQAWFWKDENGDSQPGPARLEIWRS
jgi:predicted small lipoprotein YifL